MSIVRDNLMMREGYRPYCGDADCNHGMPRTSFDGEQFVCPCGWRSGFEVEFIHKYKKKWHSVPVDIDGLDTFGVEILDKPRERNCLEVVVQRENGRQVRYFGSQWELIYNQCHKNPKVLMYNPL